MVTEKDILKRFQNLHIGRSGDLRAPHKPLLMLWAIARCLRGKQRLVSYDVVDKDLAELMRLFGPHGRPQNTHQPFWRLQNDECWEVDRADLIRTTTSGEPFRSDLRQHQVCGGLTTSDYMYLQNNPLFARQIAESLVAEHFPASIFDEVFEAVSFPLSVSHSEEAETSVKWSVTKRSLRDSLFRASVLSAYESSCAVCKFSVRFQKTNQPLAIEAAHVKWHVYDGPSEVENGLALCALHHRLFDKGAFTVLPNLMVKVSPDIQGVGGDNALWQYDSQYLQTPGREGFPRPRQDFLLWHGREVFKNPELLNSI